MQQLRIYRPQARTQDVVVCTNPEKYLGFFLILKKKSVTVFAVVNKVQISLVVDGLSVQLHCHVNQT